MYSPSALAEYGIGVPVMNLGLGVERLAMIAYNANDVRQLCFPQFSPRQLTDREILRAVHLPGRTAIRRRKTDRCGYCTNSAAHATEQGPCSFEVWGGENRGIATESDR